MLIDITLEITPKMTKDAQGNERKALTGHLGTHFDVMDKEFPLEYTKRQALCFDAAGIDEIEAEDIELSLVENDMFVLFRTGYIEQEGYGTETYFREHPQLSQALIEELLERGVSMIGIDAAGVRRGKEHTPTDQRCADRGAFVIENLAQLSRLPCGQRFTVHTYPMRYAGMTGLPCRVVAEI